MAMLEDSFIPEPEGEERTQVMALAQEIMAFAKQKGKTPVECAQACYYVQKAMTFAVLKKTTDGILERADSDDYVNKMEEK